jgi:hypothetical protein
MLSFTYVRMQVKILPSPKDDTILVEPGIVYPFGVVGTVRYLESKLANRKFRVPLKTCNCN